MVVSVIFVGSHPAHDITRRYRPVPGNSNGSYSSGKYPSRRPLLRICFAYQRGQLLQFEYVRLRRPLVPE